MVNKRKHHTGFGDNPSSYTKRRRPTPPELLQDDAAGTPYSVQSRVDPTYGQRGAFPGLDETAGEYELFYGPASNGLEYLRMVRTPAPDRKGEPGSGDEFFQGHDTGYYEDGAYTALPVPSSTSSADVSGGSMLDEETRDIDLQEAYYASLAERFLELRSTLRSPPNLSAGGQPNGKSSTLLETASAFHRMNHESWRKQLLYRTPQMLVLAYMNQETVIRGLTRLETLLSRRNLLADREAKIIGAWSWGLLARCRDPGEMISEEVGVLRTVAKTALRLAVKLRMLSRASQEVGGYSGNAKESGVSNEANSESEEQADSDDELPCMEMDSGVSQIEQPNGDSVEHEAGYDDLEDGEISDSNESLDALAIAKKSLLAQAHCSTAPVLPDMAYERTAQQASDIEERAYATLDMVVTIVGEFYGQRDLLDARAAWKK